jgi:hypothetical protein
MRSVKLLLILVCVVVISTGFDRPKNQDIIIPIDGLEKAVNVTSKEFPNVQLAVSGKKLMIAVIRESGDVPVHLEISEDGNIKVSTSTENESEEITVIDGDGDGLPEKRLIFIKDSSSARLEELKVVVE